MDDKFDERLRQLERAVKTINTIQNNPELQIQAFNHLFNASTLAPPQPTAGTIKESRAAGLTTKAEKGASKVRVNGKRANKATDISIDKTLDTAPKGVEPWKSFVDAKKPTNLKDQNLVAVYWLTEVASNTAVSASQIVTLFVDAKWKLASNVKNSLQVTASTTGYLDTADMNDIKITARGISHVLNSLPTPDKK